MTCDSCKDPVCEKCIVITKGAREGNQCKKCKNKTGATVPANANANEATVGA
jgi:hypothetical protein